MFPETGPLSYHNYPLHLAFMAAGADHMERLMIAGNRCGKSETAAYEIVCHLTGIYPKWWKGRVFKKPVAIWVAGNTSETTRDIIQTKLLGSIERESGTTNKVGIGTGLIPADKIIAHSPKAGVSGAIGEAWVRHSSGGASSVGFKSFGVSASGQPAESFFGVRRDAIWIDEECGEAVYNEALIRLMSTVPGEDNGIMLMTFTPLNGYTSVVKRFLETEDPGISVHTVTWDDCPHLSENSKQAMRSKFLPSQLKARSQGIPAIGEGAIYPIDIDEISVDPFTIPDTWPRCFGMDVGKTAVVWVAHDRDSDIAYAYSEHFSTDYNTTLQVEAIKARGIWVPGSVDPSSLQSNQMDGQKLFDIYKAKGLNIEWERTGVESGIGEIWLRLSTGRLKLFSSLTLLRKEFQRYHRSKSETVFGVQDKIVKKDDHLCDALRYAIVSALPRAKCHFTPQLKTPDIFQQRSGSLSSGDGGWMAQ
jgi:phage terminase large subunit-like protein